MRSIEISLDRERHWLIAVAIVIGLLTVVGLGALGRAVTPPPGRLLSWADWQAFKLERQYRTELAQLRANADELAQALNTLPDPIRVGLLHDRLLQRHHTGLSALEPDRAALLTANEAVYQWATGALSREQALTAVQVTLEALQP